MDSAAPVAELDTPSAQSVQLGLYVEINARPDKINEVAHLLTNAQALVEAEPGTLNWFAVRVGDTRFAIFDTFNNESDREAHLNGEVAKALMGKAEELLSETPQIHKCEILAAKYPMSAI